MRIELTASMILGLAALVSAPLAQGQAQEPRAVEAQPATLDEAAISLNEPDQDAVDVNCVRETGTRMASKARRGDPKACQPGRAYDRGDIERTGATSLGEALQRLDPGVTIRRR